MVAHHKNTIIILLEIVLTNLVGTGVGKAKLGRAVYDGFSDTDGGSVGMAV